MTSHRLLTVLAAAAALLVTAAVAVAAPSNVDISRAIYATVNPPDVGRPSHVVYSVDTNKDGNRAGRTPRTIIFRFDRGFKIDRGAVAGRCSSGQAQSFSCPADSRIGSASIVAVVQHGAKRVTGQVNLFLRRASTGTVAADVRTAGHRRATTGRLVRVNNGVYGYELRLDALSAAAGGRVERIHADLGSTHTAAGKRVALIRNPGICPNGWHYGVAVVYSDGVQHRGDGLLSCRHR